MTRQRVEEMKNGQELTLTHGSSETRYQVCSEVQEDPYGMEYRDILNLETLDISPLYLFNELSGEWQDPFF